MKLRNLIPFLTFSAVTEHPAIEQLFTDRHLHYQSRFPYWSTLATRRKLVIHFWYNEVFRHFLALSGLGLITTIIARPYSWLHATTTLPVSGLLFVAFIVLLPLFMGLLLFIYLPAFSASYLPFLDSYIENYTGKQLESIQKCKKQQFSVKTLLLIQYSLQNMAGLSDRGLDETYTGLLTKQYRVSKQMIETAYKELFLGKWDGRTGRKYTEMVQSFDEAEDYFRLLGAERTFPVLAELQARVLRKTRDKTSPS